MAIVWIYLLLIAVFGIPSVYTQSTIDPNCKDFRHKNGPRIFPCKKEITLKVGQNFSITCKGKTDIKFRQQDIPEDKTGNFDISQSKIGSDDPEYKYAIAIELINVDRYAIGYYACMDVSVKESVLNNLVEEPNDTDNISYIYIYVEGTGSLFAPMSEFVTCKSKYYIVECRPTTPDVEVKLNLDIPEFNDYKYNPKIGFAFDIDAFADYDLTNLMIFKCGFRKQSRTEDQEMIFFKHQEILSDPVIKGNAHQFLRGDTFTMNCTVDYIYNSALEISWKYPDNIPLETITEQDNNNVKIDGKDLLFSTTTIRNASEKHAGNYLCIVNYRCGNKFASYEKKLINEPELFLRKINTAREGNKLNFRTKKVGLSVSYKAFPPVTNFTFFRNKVPIKSLPNYENDYNITWKKKLDEVSLVILDSKVEDTANYTLKVTNGLLTKEIEPFDVRIVSAPKINFGEKNITCVQNMKMSYKCEVTGYPLPTVKWMFNGKDLDEDNHINTRTLSLYKLTTTLDLLNCIGGNLTCKAKNSQNETSVTKILIVYELENGFGIYNKGTVEKKWQTENEDLEITCLASKYKFRNVTWVTNKNVTVEYPADNNYSLVAKLKIKDMILNHQGDYECVGTTIDGKKTSETVNVRVAARESPQAVLEHTNLEVSKFQPVHFNCQAKGVPQPTIVWFKDGQKFNDKNAEVSFEELDYKTVNSSIKIANVEEVNGGTYTCNAIISDKLKDSKQLSLVIKVSETLTKILIPVSIVIFVAIVVVAYFIWRDKKLRRLYKSRLHEAGLLYFVTGAPESLNPKLGIDEQAELLPYNPKFEFPEENLKLGIIIGSGAFGQVYIAQARGMIDAEKETTVAVKKVSNTAENIHINALVSELKIMVHLGKHVNIVNLLGACTKNVSRRQLMVIVEYCMYGNIQNYMRQHKEVFIDQFSDNEIENNRGTVNIGYSHSGNNGGHSEYLGSANTQDTFLNSANTNRSSRKNIRNQPTEEVKVSEGYIDEPTGFCNYEGNYSSDGAPPRPLTSKDLLAWSFQIARGMEYLAKRKILHGDLAARNVLLAENNIVKICDFGLARRMYNNDEYRKKDKGPLPVKWLAIECITSNIYSTQSDVWSFGILLWEIFSLGTLPYPNIKQNEILSHLSNGYRMEKPPYSDDRIYEVMKRCWDSRPTARPSFTHLQEILGNFLADDERNRYVDLDAQYLEVGPAQQEDYLTMVSAPDYNNIVTPNPRHYANNMNIFFPNKSTNSGDEGYQVMSPPANSETSNMNSAGGKFDFDVRIFNTRQSEASESSELTPMLRLNKLDARCGSDSDQERPKTPNHNASCPEIDMETEEVFETRNKLNIQNSAVSNPTYITLDNNMGNGYVNVPNGSVK